MQMEESVKHGGNALSEIMQYARDISYTNKYNKSDVDKYIDILCCGLLSEIGEVADCFHKCDRDCWTNEQFFEKMTKELGDCMWYAGQILIACEDFLGFTPNSLDSIIHLNKGVTSSWDLRSTPISKVIQSVMNGEGASYENFKCKDPFIRRIIEIILTASLVIDLDLFKVGQGVRLEHRMNRILSINSEKLKKRYEENKISGSGSDR